MNEKRKEFYVTSLIWNEELSCYAKTVLAYMSYCANREGVCYPSMRRIADECHMCRSSAIKAVNELVEKGLISKEMRAVNTARGSRQTSNLYRLLAPRGERKPAPKADMPVQQILPVTAVSEQAPIPAAKRGEKPAHKPPEPLTECDGVRDGPEPLLERLNISGLYRNKPAAKAIELAISDMWYTESFRFKGEAISRRRVRERLNELDIDAIDTVMDEFANAENAADKTAYLKALIYNAPLQSNALIGHGIEAARL